MFCRKPFRLARATQTIPINENIVTITPDHYCLITITTNYCFDSHLYWIDNRWPLKYKTPINKGIRV